MRNLDAAPINGIALSFAAVVALSYLVGQVAGAIWTGKIFLCADPVAIPIALVTFLLAGALLLRAEWIEISEFLAIGGGAALGFIFGHLTVLIVAATTDTLLKRILRDGNAWRCHLRA